MEPIKVIPLSEMYTAVWGKQGENNAVQLSYDLTGWENVWPDGGAAVAFRRADGKEYAHEFVREGNTLLIPVKAYDTEIFGSCAVVISWIDNGSEARSVIINGRVNESIVSMGETPSVPEMGVIEMMNEQAAAADAARASANEAKEAAELAQAKAETAQRKAETAQAEAEKAVNDAGEKADEAHSAAAEAKEHAQSANDAKNAADEHAQEAYQQFVAAEKAAVNAQMARDDAKIAETNAEAFSGESKRHAMTAKDYAEDAADSESMAKVHADAAKEAAENATNGVFIVKYDGSGFDKTYREIEDAARSGKSPVVVHARAGTIYTYGTLDASNRRYFDSFEYDRDGMLFNSCLRISPDNTVANVSRGVVKTPTTRKLKFTGAATGEFDGSESVSIEIPDGGNDEIIIIHTANGTTDKTYNEISTAITKGKTAVMIDTIMGKVFPYTHASANGYVFSNVYRNPDGKLINFAYTLKPNNTVAQNATNNVLTPNPKKITFTGAVDAEYDGSSDVTVEIPEGGTGGGGGSASKYKQPEWGAETAIVDILPEAEYSIMSEEEPIAVITSPVSHALVVGDTYEVIYNGTSYNCTCVRDDSGNYALGNMGAAGGDYPDTGEPFMIGFFDEGQAAELGFHAMIAPLDGSTTFTLSINGEVEVIHAIPAKYVENKTVMRVNVSNDMVADKTYDEVAEAIEAGAHVYLAVSDVGGMGESYITFYHMAYTTQDGAIAFCEAANKLMIAWASDGTISRV